MPNPLDEFVDWANENIVEPVVDLAEEIGEEVVAVADDVAAILTDVGIAVGQVAGDALRALGLDPDQLAQEFQNLSEAALNAFLDFLNSIKLMKEKAVTMISVMNILKNNSLTFEQRLTHTQIQVAFQLRSAVKVVMDAIQSVGRSLRFLIDLLPALQIRQTVINVNPQLAIWLDI